MMISSTRFQNAYYPLQDPRFSTKLPSLTNQEEIPEQSNIIFATYYKKDKIDFIFERAILLGYEARGYSCQANLCGDIKDACLIALIPKNPILSRCEIIDVLEEDYQDFITFPQSDCSKISSLNQSIQKG